MKKNILILLLIAISSVAFAQKSDNYTVDPAKSSINWNAKRVAGGYDGTINISNGTLTVAKNKITGGKFTIDTRSIAAEKGSTRLISHLKNEDFFDVEKYPTATFVITGIKQDKDNSIITGDITIKGITKSISFPASVAVEKNVLKATASNVKIDRTKFGIQYNSGSIFSGLGDKAIEDEFTLNIALTANKK